MHRRAGHHPAVQVQVVAAGPAPSLHHTPTTTTNYLPRHHASPPPASFAKDHDHHHYHPGVLISPVDRLRGWLLRHVRNSFWREKVSLISFLVVGSVTCLLGVSNVLYSSIASAPRIVLLGKKPSDVASEEEEKLLNRMRRATSVRPIRMELPVNNLESEEFYRKNDVVEDNSNSGCPYIADWQRATSGKPTCNVQHEIGIQFGDNNLYHRLEPINSGAFKDVWKILAEGDHNPLPAVLKTTAYDYDFVPRYIYRYRRDALVMEQTSASPYVLDMYSYCAYSTIVEAAKGTVRDWLEEFYPEESDEEDPGTKDYDSQHHPPPQQLLRVATMMAKGLEDAQLYTESGLPTFAHADIKASQFLVTTTSEDPNHPILKLNDFNRGRLLSAKDHQICPFYMSSHHKGSTNRSPEEYEKRGPQTDKIDVFSLGSTLYELLTGETPFEYIPDYKKALNKILKGKEPPLPMALKETTDPSLQALLLIVEKSRQFRPEDRPTSREVAQFLQEKWDAVKQQSGAPQTGTKVKV